MISIPYWLAEVGRMLNRAYYRQLLPRQCSRQGTHPQSWFDHRIDLYCAWPYNLFWMERGLYARRLMSKGCRVLDLCCGDGFFAYHFYASIAGHIDAVDVDPRAIEHAARLYSLPNIRWLVLDATSREFPAERYDVVTMYEAVDHFSREQYRQVAARIRRAIGQTGVLVGSVGLSENAGQKGHWEHQNEFCQPEPLEQLLKEDFGSVTVEVTAFPLMGGGERRTAHFVARNPDG